MYLKKLFTLTISICALAATAGAQSELKIITVNLGKALGEYYKTQQAVEKLSADQNQAMAKIDEMQIAGSALVEQYKEMEEQSKNIALTESAREKAKEDAQKKGEEIQAKQNELQQFSTNAQRMLDQQRQTHQTLMLDEIQKVVDALAYERGVTLVLDVSGASSIGAPVVLYSSAAYDITDDVLAILNKDKPAEVEKPAAAE
jgi:Skp family chaperone for outer membrane proteins